jgi:ABC-type nitrate/sulfonate/bicarbonate transport system substrate-binding protein
VGSDEGVANAPTSRLARRRQIIRWAAGGIAALGIGYVGYRVVVGSKRGARLGIAPGSQTLWRYVAQRKDEFFGPLGDDVAFETYPDENALRSAFVSDTIQVMASLVPTVASLADAGVAAQLFLPIAWLKEGYPFVVPVDSPIHTLADLLGRRIATYPIDHPGMAYWLALSLATANLNLLSLNPTESLSPDALLQQHAVDAACMGGAQWAALQRNQSYRKVADLETAWRLVSGSARLLIFGGYIARRELIQQQPELIGDLMKVHVQALRAYKQERASFLKTTSDYAGGPVMQDSDNQAQATYLGYDDVDVDRMTIGDQDVQDYQRLFGLMAQGGYLRAAPRDVGSLFYRTS